MKREEFFADVPASRRLLMGRVKGSNTKPELAVRAVLHAIGRRFRLHRRDLPGSPDIVLPRHRIAIFVHGCYWHRHSGCRGATTPKTRESYWAAKFDANVSRDEAAVKALEAQNWKVLIVWECETKNRDMLKETLVHRLTFLGSESGKSESN